MIEPQTVVLQPADEASLAPRFGTLLKMHLAYHKNMTHSQLAEKIGVPRTYVSKLVNYKTVPTIKSIEKVASVFKLTVSEFMSFTSTDQVAFARHYSQIRTMRKFAPLFSQLTRDQRQELYNKALQLVASNIHTA
jgi:transcriptional regulator with XRE-family HTH domain